MKRLARVRHLGLFCFWSVCIYATRFLAKLSYLFPIELSLVFSLAGMLVIAFACIKIIIIHIERLHDFDFSGWWILLCFLPFIGQLWLLVILFKRGNDGANHYGAPPSAPSETDYLRLSLIPLVVLCELLIKSNV